MKTTETFRHSRYEKEDEQSRQRMLIGILLALLLVAAAIWMYFNRSKSTRAIEDKIYHLPMVNHHGDVVDDNGNILVKASTRNRTLFPGMSLKE